MRFALVPHALHDPGAPPEEAATSGILSIKANGMPLTEGVSVDDDVLKAGPLVSAYPLAEWLVWNWWRLRWEPTPPRADRAWGFAHRLSSVGGGYRWPNLELASDEVRVRMTSRPSAEPESGTFRYVGAPRSEAVPAQSFESAVDAFVRGVLGRLHEERSPSSNLGILADELAKDRSDEARSSFRRVEAMLGSDPGEGDATAIRRRLSEASSLGERAVLELAASATPVGVPELRANLGRAGFDFRPDDTVKLDSREPVPTWGATDAWRIGVVIARHLRTRELRNGEPVTNRRLAEMMGPMSASCRMPVPLRIACRSSGRWVAGRRWHFGRSG